MFLTDKSLKFSSGTLLCYLGNSYNTAAETFLKGNKKDFLQVEKIIFHIFSTFKLFNPISFIVMQLISYILLKCNNHHQTNLFQHLSDLSNFTKALYNSTNPLAVKVSKWYAFVYDLTVKLKQ